MGVSKLRQCKFRHSKQMVSTQLSARQNAWQGPWRDHISNQNSTEGWRYSVWKARQPWPTVALRRHFQHPHQVPKCNGPGCLRERRYWSRNCWFAWRPLCFGHCGAPPPVDVQNADRQSVDLVGNRENVERERVGSGRWT